MYLNSCLLNASFYFYKFTINMFVKKLRNYVLNSPSDYQHNCNDKYCEDDEPDNNSNDDCVSVRFRGRMRGVDVRSTDICRYHRGAGNGFGWGCWRL